MTNEVTIKVTVDDKGAVASVKALKAEMETAGEELGKSTSKGYEKGTKDTEKTTEQVAKRTQAQFSALQFAGLSEGLPAAAAIGAAGTGAALAGVPLIFAAIAASALRNNQQVQGSFASLTSTVENDTQAMAAPLAGQLSSSINQVRAEFVALEPQIADAMVGGARDVDILTKGVTGFARNAMPGLVVAVNSSQAPLRAFSDLAVNAGSGVTDFFRNLSAGSQGAATGISILSVMVRDAEGFAGTFFAQIANGSAGPLTQLQAVLHNAEGALVNLTSAGSPAIGFLTGFGGAASGAVSIVRLLSGVLNLLPPQVGQLAGSVTATTMILSKFGVDAGASFKGLGEKIKAAEGPMATLKTAGAGLVSAALSPAVLATAGLSIGLAILGQRQQDAAAAAQAHTANVQKLSGILRESNGVVTASVQAQTALALTSYQVQDGTRNLLVDTQKLAGPSGMVQLTQAYDGNRAAGDALGANLQGIADKHSHLATGLEIADGLWKGNTRTVNGVTIAYDEQGLAAIQLKDNVDAVTRAGQENSANNQNVATTTAQMSLSQKLAQQASADLAGELTTIADAASSATDRTSAFQLVLDTLTGRTPSLENSLKTINDNLRTLADEFGKNLSKADGWGKSLLNADNTVNSMSKNGSSLLSTLESMQAGWSGASASVDELVKSGMSFEDASKKVNTQLSTERQRFLDLAPAMGLSKDQAQALLDKYGLFPSVLPTEFSQPGMDGAQSAADILRGKVLAIPDSHTVVTSALTQDAENRLTALGFHVQRLPDGTVRVFTDTGPAYAGLNQIVRDGNNRVIRIRVDTVQGYTNVGVGTGGYHSMQATGGPARAAGGGPRGSLTLVGEQGPELVHLPTGSFVRPATNTSNDLAQMAAVGAAQPVQVQLVASPSVDSAFATLIMRMVRSGDLQLVAAT